MKLSNPNLYLLSCFAFAACMASSCSSDSPDVPAAGEGAEVTFDVKGLARAAATTSFDHFAVYGDMKYMDYSNTEPKIVFNKTLVEYSNGNWTYKDVQYWFPGHEHSFVAVYPMSALEAENNPHYSNSNLSFTYNLPLSEDGLVNDGAVTDIITATYRRLFTESSSASPVLLRFSHLFSQLNFLVELTEPSSRSDEFFKIHKLKITGFGSSATVNIKPASRLDNPQTDDSEITILTAKGNNTLEINFDEPIKVVNGASAVKMFDDNNAIILLPQTFGAEDKVNIFLTYSLNDEDETTEVSVAMSDFRWESGKSYNYKLKLDLPEAKEANLTITNATIDPWNLIDDHSPVDAK